MPMHKARHPMRSEEKRRGRLFTTRSSEPKRLKRDGYRAAPECKGGGKREIPEKNPPTSDIVRHDSHTRKFSRGSPIPPPFHSGAAPYSPRFTLFGSQDLEAKTYPNLFARSLYLCEEIF
ncbi:hypothetical protein PR048_025003 [Dryococelus australis]|uniref:Uncharacterized protein n=1 Tax=Dryococelus australis TaxID=614101 RepID=A0ABQ9GQ85_9NEOP|nr:hypothetical protein PR048_025003 [Dryococelus australis]